MSKGFFFSEESPDRQYFTIVPNYVVNHSTVWEQSVYLTMKRLAGEEGRCYATHQKLADRLKISRPTVSKTINNLLKRGWLKEVGLHKGKTHPIKEYRVVDLWKLNIEFYQKIRKPQNQSFRDTSTVEPIKGSVVDTSLASFTHKEEDLYRRRNNITSKEVIDDSVVNLTPHKKILPVNRLVSLLEKKLGAKIVNYGKQAKAWKMMERAGYTEEQVRRTILYMADQDDFFSEKGFDLMTVANNIARYKAEAERRRLND